MFDAARGRYEIEFEVEEAFFHTGSESLVHLTVTNVRHRKARRASPRVGVSVKLDARVRYCRTMPRDAQVEVRLIDVSATGLAFVTQRELSAGDMFQLSFPLAGELMEIETRVVRLDPAPYGRYRAGCEITEISDAAPPRDQPPGRGRRAGRIGRGAPSRADGGPLRGTRRIAPSGDAAAPAMRADLN